VPKTTAMPTPVVVQPLVTPPVSTETPVIKQKLQDLELSQYNLRSELNAANSRLDTINNTMNSLNEKIATLTQGITRLSETVEAQANRLTLMTAMQKKPKVVHKRNHFKPNFPRVVYNIQAVIPGRAWLIASNGSTLTVREGSEISGYGVVRLIDAAQGRVTMSSGRVIRFSQEDS
jgi:intracellular multiplication protein IcmG